MKRCTRCILPETFPNIEFDAEGVCQYCRMLPPIEERLAQKKHLHAQLEKLIGKIRQQPGYHCLVAWSGGKDSTYAIWLLKQHYHLNVLSFTLDNSFISDVALKNIRLVAERLNLDHITVKPRFKLIKKLFTAAINGPLYAPQTLNHVSNLCLTRAMLTEIIALRITLELGIPLLTYGWLPGQFPLDTAFQRTTREMLQGNINKAKASLGKVAGPEIEDLFPRSHALKKTPTFPVIAAPLALLDSNEQTILHCVESLGWEHPPNYTAESTNCLLDSFAIQLHLQQKGYHPQVTTLAGMVREGYLSREAALARLQTPIVPEIVSAVRAKLGFPPTYLPNLVHYRVAV